MPLNGCDVLLVMPWCHKVKAILDTFNRKITVTHRNKEHILDVRLKGESISLVSASAISRVMNKHLSAYLVFVKEKQDTLESNLDGLDKDN